MVVETLSLDTINANSPYEVKLADAVDTLCFITDYDAEIFVTFERDELLHEGLVYQFGISNPKRVKSPRDPKVRETILAIVEEFFAKNQAAFLYICDTSGGMQKMRNRLFQYWFGIYGEREEYVFLPQTITDEEGNDNYAALIIRKDNPQFANFAKRMLEECGQASVLSFGTSSSPFHTFIPQLSMLFRINSLSLSP